ncbi:MAG TPA: PAAR domain-containing protein [Polyangiales bacterium]|nr:PAAR domain-containing protein [Polyangiales bacterium]
MASLKAAADQAQAESVAVSQVVDGASSLPDVKPMENPAAAVAQVGGAILGVAGIGAELADTGIAVMTNSISAMLPAFPAAHLGSLYLGIPHAHAHPPSLIPPAPPVPLPTIGAITLGTSIQVLVGGMPSARAGDIGLAPTCGGIAPFFTVFLASSKVFFGGTRAARQTDMCTACTPSDAAVTRATSTAMKAAAKAAAMASMAADALGQVVAVAAIAGSAIDAVKAHQASEDAAAEAEHADGEVAAAEAQAEAVEQGSAAAANAVAAGMAAAQMAADAAASAMSATMGMDPAIPPGMIGTVTLGQSRVLVGGMPIPNIPDPAQWLLKKIAAKAKLKFKTKGERTGGGGGCKG